MNLQFKNFQKYIFPVILVCVFFALAKTAQAVTYYVDATGGNDSWTGTAGARSGTTSTGPWKTVSKVNSFAFQTGDDVYFKCGETWTSSYDQDYLTVDWSGVDSSNQAIIGAYYLSGNIPFFGISGNRPKFNGNGIAPGPDDSGVPFRWRGLLRIIGVNFVILKDLEILNTNGYGAQIAGGSDNAIKNCLIHETDINSIFLDTTNNPVADGNSCSYFNRTFLQTSKYWGSSISSKASNNIVIRKNTIFNGYGEGIIADYGVVGGVIERNIIYNTQLNIYVCCSKDVEVRHNLVYGTSDSAWWRWGEPAAGIVIANETYCYTDPSYGTGHRVYGNFSANNNGNFHIWSSELGGYDNIKVFNNMLINRALFTNFQDKNIQSVFPSASDYRFPHAA